MAPTDPPIPTNNIQTHILLMRALHKLQVSVQPGGIPFGQYSGAPLPSDNMLRFLYLAVLRFNAWINTQEHVGTRPSLLPDHIPPLDVLMIWHAYMLSPVAYHKDAQGPLPSLNKLGGMPWDKLAACIDATTYDFVPIRTQLIFWERETGHPFHFTVGQAYTTEVGKSHKFGVDLPQAVLRQSGSLVRMLDAVDEHKDDDKSEWIRRAIEDYPRYMRLPAGNHVPPVAVDIVWHTHQLSGTTYRDECMKYFNHFIGHDDSQAPEVIQEGRNLMGQVSQGAGILIIGIDICPSRIPIAGSVTGIAKHHKNTWQGTVSGTLTGIARGMELVADVTARLRDFEVKDSAIVNAKIDSGSVEANVTIDGEPFVVLSTTLNGSVEGSWKTGQEVDVSGSNVSGVVVGYGDKCNNGTGGCLRSPPFIPPFPI